MLSETVAGALRQAWAAVGELGLPAAVMGGIALSAWRHPRNTRDADLLIGISSTGPDAILRGMQAHGFRPMRVPALVTVGPSRFLQLLYTPPGMFVDIKTDLLLADSNYQQTALNRRRPFDWPELNLNVEVLTCEDLILHKLLAGRVIDRADVIALQTANRTILDYRYLGDWLRQLSLATQWAECWAEAFPGEPDPTASS
jgi:hypothetical protein